MVTGGAAAVPVRRSAQRVQGLAGVRLSVQEKTRVALIAESTRCEQLAAGVLAFGVRRTGGAGQRVARVAGQTGSVFEVLFAEWVHESAEVVEAQVVTAVAGGTGRTIVEAAVWVFRRGGYELRCG